jgi:uncharacterized membrane protein YbhN (UPF0104 family)
MPVKPTDQEKRSREIADKLRTYLAALNTGGIAVPFGVASSLAGLKVNPTWAVWPVSVFAFGLALLAASLLLAKHKALKRRDNPQVDFALVLAELHLRSDFPPCILSCGGLGACGN